MWRRPRQGSRRLLVCALPLAAAVVLVACDTDDGRDLREPNQMQRLNLSQTSTTTTTTTTTTLAPVLTPAPTQPATTAAATTSAASASAPPSAAPASTPAER